jgi:hypothetical protein
VYLAARAPQALSVVDGLFCMQNCVIAPHSQTIIDPMAGAASGRVTASGTR